MKLQYQSPKLKLKNKVLRKFHPHTQKTMEEKYWMSHYRPRKHEFNPKKSPKVDLQERRRNFLDIVQKDGPIKDIILQLKLGLGDGQYERLKRGVKSLYPELVEWHKKTKTWKNIPSDPNQPWEKQVISKLLEVLQTE